MSAAQLRQDTHTFAFAPASRTGNTRIGGNPPPLSLMAKSGCRRAETTLNVDTGRPDAAHCLARYAEGHRIYSLRVAIATSRTALQAGTDGLASLNSFSSPTAAFTEDMVGARDAGSQVLMTLCLRVPSASTQ